MKPAKIIEKHFNPITSVIGSLGIYKKIDFVNHEVVEYHANTSIFRCYRVAYEVNLFEIHILSSLEFAESGGIIMQPVPSMHKI
jgi:hypothetical protein